MAVTGLQHYKSRKVNYYLIFKFLIVKNLESFDAYRLEKDQMARISGGLICDVYYDDELGGSVSIPFQSNDKNALEEALWEQHPDATAINCW